MQNIFSFVQTQSAPATPFTPTVKNESADSAFSDSFFSIIMGQIAQESKTPVNNELPITLASEEVSTLSTSDDSEAKSIDEHLLDDLLSVVNALQQNTQTTVFPSLNSSSSLEKILGSETARQDFANVKSVSDLVDLSNKYNLGLEKLSITQENIDALQAKFPTLAQNNFFDDLQSALDATKSSLNNDEANLAKTPTTNNVISLLDKQQQKTETTTTPSILSELISKDIKTEPKTTPIVDNTLDDAPVVEVEETVIVNEKQQNNQKQTSTLQSLLQDKPAEKVNTPIQTPTEKVNTPLQTVIQKVVTTNETPSETEVVVEETVVKTEVTVEKTPIKAAIVAEETVVKTTRVNETKMEKQKSKEDISDTIIKTATTEKTSDDTINTTDEIGLMKKTTTTEETETSDLSSDEPQKTTDVRSDLKAVAKQDTTAKIIPVKESLNQFANDLREKIEAYKPPIMKVELSLNPKNLGDVDVTLLTRGNNLHVNISSTSNTMSLFTQNQAEVKTALINMGFTNLEMNFSDQRNSEQSQQNQKHSSGKDFEEFSTELNEENTASLEIVIPQYV